MSSEEIFENIEPMLNRDKPNMYNIDNEISSLCNGNNTIIKEVKEKIKEYLEKKDIFV